MAKFKVGDKVRIKKPVDTSEGPAWVDGMGECDGKTAVVCGRFGYWYYLQGHAYQFDERWLSKANTFKGNV